MVKAHFFDKYQSFPPRPRIFHIADSPRFIGIISAELDIPLHRRAA
jgi:hypothetical protein